MTSRQAALLKLLQSLPLADVLQIPGVIEYLSTVHVKTLQEIEQRLSWCKAEAWQDKAKAKPIRQHSPDQLLSEVAKKKGDTECYICGARRSSYQAKWEACSECRERLRLQPSQFLRKAAQGLNDPRTLQRVEDEVCLY